ncbi:winged helix-turn-helix domain-containing protein [Haloarcula sp. JP-L23]|uniref:winged helix-turn-helix domain-containing protein n=1 Tax=Haloarcula sp. JP-L23 TaxID=2716717 RepID=UPI00140EFBC7|nr:winged helix-turn-helix transcriptional regulator [Haloarcula sp. JP-L23]
MTSDEQWDDVSFVISSRYRVGTLHRLAEGPATPSLISDETGHSIAHISRALQELRDVDLITLLVSEDRRKGRVYGITDAGTDVWDTIEAQNMIDAE